MNKTVYHYTSPDGILSILKNKTLRFTDCQYLNDASEFVYISEPLDKEYKMVMLEYGETFKNIVEDFNTLLQSPYTSLGVEINPKKKQSAGSSITFKSYRYYVLCASENPDAINMWNYYSKNGIYQGYNLGIDCDHLKDCLNLNNTNDQIKFIEGKVIYDKKIQVEMIYKKAIDLLTIYKENANKTNDNFHESMCFNYFRDEMFGYINKQKLFFKNPAFAGEEEYRFVLQVDNRFFEDKESPINKKFKLDFRVGASGIITPFIEWKFNLTDKENMFKQITLAPMIESTLAKESFNRFLISTVRTKINIKQSSIKLRF